MFLDVINRTSIIRGGNLILKKKLPHQKLTNIHPFDIGVTAPKDIRQITARLLV